MGTLRIRLFGSLHVERDGRDVTPRRTDEGGLLAVLATRPNVLVTAGDLVAAVWPGSEPLRPRQRVTADLGGVTRALAGADPRLARLDVTDAGWTLHLAPGVTDLDDFRATLAHGQADLAARRVLAAESRLARAVQLAARPAHESFTGPWFAARRQELEAEVLTACLALTDAWLAIGADDDLPDRIDGFLRRFGSSPALWERLVHAQRALGQDADIWLTLRRAEAALGRQAWNDHGDALHRLRTRPAAMPVASPRVAALGRPAPGASRPLSGTPADDRVASSPTPPLRFSLFGPFRALRHGRDVTPAGAVPTALLAALVLSRGRSLPATELAAAMWTGRTPLDPEAAVRMEARVLTSQLRATTPPRAVVERGPDGWLLDLPDPCTDAEEVDALARTGLRLAAEGRSEAAVDPLLDAWTIYGDRPLDGLDGPWFEPRRLELDDRAARAGQVLADALVDATLARTTTPADRIEHALGLLEGLVARFPRSLDLRERLMTGYHLVGDTAGALAVRDDARYELGAHWRGRAAAAIDDLHATLTRPARTAPAPDAGPTAPVPDAARPLPPPAPASWVAASAPRTAPAPPSPLQVRLAVLDGSLVAVDGLAVRLPDAACHRMLTALLLRHGTAVADGDLVDAAGVRQAADPSATVDALLAAVRTALDGVSPGTTAALAGALSLRTSATAGSPPGRAALVRPGVLDLEVAQTLAARGTAALAAGRADAAATDLRAALEQVPSRLLPGLDGGWFAAERTRLGAWRDRTARACVDAELAAGHPEAAVADLRALIRRHPLDEGLTEQLMTALAGLGRHDDALAAYASLDRRLREHLGTGPGPTVQMLRRRLLDTPG
ncbi:BTAD domain-containing putative transcriptional regulator [Kineosporia sp. A_224]|uniref:AfsR/SARP family transcriptional regulator n=1 Tax=Kineosporia sp. A_224 TaxID=1962180 RepID=UPI001179F61B|nr:BTAD domain-containing putative transcriptional regulator [Kineosporia sp. A_224]